MTRNHRYSLKSGFIGPLTRRQTLRREYNRRQQRNRSIPRTQLRAPEPSASALASAPALEWDGGSYFDNFVDGKGW